MYILLIVLILFSGQKQVKTSLVEGPDAHSNCLQSLPLVAKLYKQGKFQDGPDPKQIRRIRGMCQKVDEDTKVANERYNNHS